MLRVPVSRLGPAGSRLAAAVGRAAVGLAAAGAFLSNPPVARADDAKPAAPARRTWAVSPEAAASFPTGPIPPVTMPKVEPTSVPAASAVAVTPIVIAGSKTTPDGKAKDADADYDTHRFEPAGFPLIGGDSDIGFEFGAVGTLTNFGNGIRPYIWNMDLLLAASVKSGTGKSALTQQNYLWDIDVPGLQGGKLRVTPAVSYESTTNQAYFGLGNNSSSQLPAGYKGNPATYFQYNEREARVRELTRIAWKPPWDIMVATTYRYDSPGIYGNSKLSTDANNHVLRGTDPISLAVLGLGLVYDTRDNEFFPHRGSYHQIGMRAVQGFPTSENVEYGAFAAMLAHYVPLTSTTVLAFRGVVDAEFGHVPLLDLYTGGPFQTYEMIGGSAAVRGVPDGRYSGPLKVLGNAELRSLFIHFTLLKQRFRLGGNVLFDAGRLWSDYSFNNPKDGKSAGIKWGTGLGGYIVWGQAAVFRVEVAYSPDASSENPGLPLGIYVEDGVMF